MKRNRLQLEKAENLVFVHNNLRLISHKSQEYKEGETKKWDVGAELADLDASTARLTIDDFDDFDVNTIVDSVADPIGLGASNSGGGEGGDEEEDEEEEDEYEEDEDEDWRT